MIVVVGSGPAGIAAAHALVKEGKDVTIVDAGGMLEARNDEARARMASQTPEEWSSLDLKTIIGPRYSNTETIHSKLSYGSGFATEVVPEKSSITWETTPTFYHSLARGGLSNIWGSALLPYRQEDLAGWPIGIAELDPHYRAVMKFIPGTHHVDALDTILPARSDRPQNLHLSAQGSLFFNKTLPHLDRLQKAGILIGRSRVAVDADGLHSGVGCAYCGLCLSGCPYELIYSSAQTLKSLIAGGKVTYIPGVQVEHFESIGDQVRLYGHHRSDGSSFTRQVNRVFLAAGVLPSAKIILSSLGLYNYPVTLLDSQYFIIPMLQKKGVSDVIGEKLHTLSQAFIEMDERKLSRHLIHLQLYGYSEFLHSELEKTFLRWPLKNRFFSEGFLGRLLIAQGFLHSRESGSLLLDLRKKRQKPDELHVSTKSRWSVKAKVLGVALKLLEHHRELGLIPLLPGIRVPSPGSGYHSGGTLPMSTHPGILQTDTLGRLPSHDRVHIVDSSVFPSIPATSITMSVMANAHRIATAAASL